MQSRWYAAKTKPRQESVALDNLARQNFTTYAPQIMIERWRRRRITCEREPLFPGYLLVRFAVLEENWRAINSTRGVIGLLTFGESGMPTPLQIKEVEGIKRREIAGDLFISEIKKVRKGDHVRLKFGIAADKIGVVVLTRGERVELLLNLLGRQTRVKAPLHAVEVIDQRNDMLIRRPLR